MANMEDNLQYSFFVEKFKRKKTTDDCYTPKAIYDLIVFHVDKYYQKLDGFNIVRPFFPDKDYRDFEYKEDDIVIDNPPFSILSKIIDFYKQNNVKFFLFCPHLTSFQYLKKEVTVIVSDCDIVYDNKAQINTDFVTNTIPAQIVLDGIIRQNVEFLQKQGKKKKTKRSFPANIQNSATLGKFIKNGIQTRIDRHNYDPISSYRNVRIFGSGAVFADNVVDIFKQRYPIVDNEEKTENLKKIISALNQNAKKITEIEDIMPDSSGDREAEQLKLF